MYRTRKTMGLSLVVSLGLFAGTASAQNLDLAEVGAMLVLPVITGGTDEGVSSNAMTKATITKAPGRHSTRQNTSGHQNLPE